MDPSARSASPLREGDLFYTQQNGKYRLYKLLAPEPAYAMYHVLAYQPLDTAPVLEQADSYGISMYHFPIDSQGFQEPTVIGNRPVRAFELIGYHEYLRQTRRHEDYTPLAISYFHEGIRLTDEKRHAEAIDAYSKAAGLFPLFYEAIDNRAFCKMDLGLWEEAVLDFSLSLEVNPVSILAEFSIGECYLRMKRYPEAKAQFEKALAIDPAHQLSKDFLQRVEALL